MKVELKKQPAKYLSGSPRNIHGKLTKALEGLEDWQGDIERLRGRKDEYRLKTPPYRIIFKYIKGEDVITVMQISTRGNAYKKG